MKVYRVQYTVNVKQYYTAYVKANSVEEAKEMTFDGDVQNERLITEECEFPENIEVFVNEDSEEERAFLRSKKINI